MGRNRKGQRHSSEILTEQQSSASSLLGTLLSYPFLWPSSKVLRFLQCAHNKVKPPNDQTNENRDDQIDHFRAKFDEEAVYAVTDNWTREIDYNQFKKYFARRLNNNCGQSALKLLGRMRDIPQHTNEFSKDDMQELQWISSKDEFDEHSFLLYWTTKFPLFVSFTWLKFSHFLQTSDAFKDYYPAGFTVPVDTGVKFQFEDYITMLHQGLQDHLDKGGMLKRYEIYSTRLEPCILELRSLPSGIIPSILSTNLALQVRFLEKEIHCQWDCIEGGNMVSSALSSYPGDYKSSPLRETLLLLSFNKNHLNILKLRYESKKEFHPTRIIICTNFENVPSYQLEKSAKHFTEIHNHSFGVEKPLRWSDLNIAVRSTILDKTIKFQRKSMRLRNIINMGNESPELEPKLESLLSSLNGETLRLLLMDKKPELFYKLTPPSEPPIYVERKLSIVEKESSKTGTITKEEDFLDQLDEQSPVIIADKPGMGKTLVLSSFARKLLKFKTRYVLFMHINEFVKRMLELTESGVVTKEKIIFALSKLVSITEFEENLVKFWLEETSGREQIVFELMLDGRDELSSKTGYNSFVDSFLEIVRNKLGGVVRLWITLRDHMMGEIKLSLKVPGYRICPYVKSDQIDFLTGYWLRTFETSDPETTILPSANGKLKLLARRCIDSLNDQSFSKSASTFSNFSKEIAGVPLQCRMLGEIYQSKANQIIVEDSDDISVIEINSVTELYEKMVEAKLVDFLKTKNLLTNIDMNDGLIVGPIRKFVTSVHIRLAIKCIFSSKCYEDLEVCDGQQSQESSESFLRYGLIINEDPLLFVHRTFAEYFVSLFVHKCLRGDFRHADETNFAKFLLERIFPVKLEQFFHDPKNQHTKNTATFTTPVICYFFDTMINSEVLVTSNNNNFVLEFREHFLDHERKVRKFDCSKSLIVAAIRHDFFNIFKLLIHCSENFYLASKQEHVFILSIAAQTTRLEFFKYLCVEIENWNAKNGNDDFRIPAEILYSALRRGRVEIVKFLVEEKGFGPETWKGHQVDDKKRNSVIHHCVCKSRKDSKQMLETKEHILQYLADLNRTILEEVDSRGRAPLLSQLETSIRLKKKLLEVGANPNAVEVEVKEKDVIRVHGKYRNSGLHWSDFIAYEKGTSPEAYHELLSSFLDHGFQINLSDAVGNTTLHCAIKTYRERILDKTLQLFKTKGADFNAKSKSEFFNGGTVLHWVTNKGCNAAFVRKLINHGCSLHERNKDGKTPLDIALAEGHKELVPLLKHESGQ